MRVSTTLMHQTALTQMEKSNSALSDLSYQITSGKKAKSLNEIAADANLLLNMEDLRTTTNTYVENLDTAKSRLSATENALQSLNDIMVEASNLYTLARNESNSEVRASLVSKAEGLANSLFSVMRTKFDGRYIFSGQDGETSPISGNPTATTIPADPPPTTYYNGDATKMKVITGNSTTESYGITGDHNGLARMKAGLEALMYGLENDSDTDIDGAIDMLQNAQSDISDMQGEVGGQMASFQLQIDRHENNKTFLQDRVDELEKVDVAEAMSKFAQQQSTLEASMMVISRLARLSLLDFM